MDILDLLDEIGVALDLAPDADTLKSRCQKSDHHEKTLTRLLQQVSECGQFIQSYVKDVSFGTWPPHAQRCKLIHSSGNRLLRNLVSDGKTVVDNFRQMLRKLREDFVSEVILAVETNIFRVLAEVEFISENVRVLGKDVKEIKENVKEVGE